MQTAKTARLPGRFGNQEQRIKAIERKGTREFRLTLLAALAHLPLGIVLYNAGPLAILHPIIVFAAGIYLALHKKFALSTVALTAAYIVGIEVLWRMAKVETFWESGKYGAAVILVIALLRRGKTKVPFAPLVYLALLIPGCVPPFLGADLAGALPILSFNLSGPLLLAVACWYFHHVQMRPVEVRRLITGGVIPISCVAFTSLFYTVTAEEIRFTGESNFATSGGFGPNQVSSILGLGVFLSVTGFVLLRERMGFRIFFAACALFSAALSVMTFSRGGIYNAIGAVIVLLIFEFRDLSGGVKQAMPVLILAAVFLIMIFPYMNEFTGGALQDRFEDTDTTNRVPIIMADLQIFLENPLFGVGVGEAREHRRAHLEFGAGSHTEFSRLLAEHGILGLGALVVLALIALTNLRRTNSTLGRAFIAGAVTWACLFMFNAGMRLAAPAFMFGMAYLTVAVPRAGRPRFAPAKFE